MDKEEILRRSRSDGKDEGRAWIGRQSEAASRSAVSAVVIVMLLFNIIWIIVQETPIALSTMLAILVVQLAGLSAHYLVRYRHDVQTRNLVIGVCSSIAFVATAVGYVLSVIFAW